MNAAEAIRGLRRMALVVAGGFVVSASGAWSQGLAGYPPSVDAYDVREVRMLPKYCIYTQLFRDHVAGANDKAMIDEWQAKLGQSFFSLHHYCWGLMKANRALLLDIGDQNRQFYLADAINEFNYVIERASDDFILLPEILTSKGKNLVLLGRGPVAVLMFERAAELKPDYWPPYAQLADYYKGIGEITKAQGVLQKGLSFSPEASALKRRLAELPSTAPSKKRPAPSSAAQQFRAAS